MKKAQIIVYLVIVMLAYCEQEQIPVGALIWHELSAFWYGLAEFAGRLGMSAEKKYYREVQHG